MKTFARLIRRYVLATAGIILVVVALLLGMTIYAGVRYNGASDSVQKVGALAEALHPTADGLQWDAAHTPAEWMHGYAWAMVLDEDGNVIWQQDLPEALNHRYTASDIAVFSRWYLADYPVHVTIRADAADGMLTIQVTDDGQGYPPAVLAVLQTGETGENPPHILGLHVVEQILAAHGGTAAFAQALPHGAAAALTLPL